MLIDDKSEAVSPDSQLYSDLAFIRWLLSSQQMVVDNFFLIIYFVFLNDHNNRNHFYLQT